MADLELLFLNAACVANKSDQQKIVQSGVAPKMFKGYEAEAQYAWNYHDKYGVFPTRKAMSLRFASFESANVREPIQYYIDQMVERKSFEGLQKIMTRVNKCLREKSIGGTQEALKEMLRAQELLQHGYSADVAWSGWDAVGNYFDREKQSCMYTFPHAQLNRMIRGVRAKNLVTIVARPAMGKTWLACVLIRWFNRVLGANVLVVSKEMTKEEIYERLDALHFDMPWIDYVEGKVRMKDMIRLESKRQVEFQQHPAKLVVTDNEELDTSGLDSVLAKIIEHSPDIVVIDGAYLLDEAEGSSLTEKMTRISRAIKRLAKNRNVLIVQTLQLNRKAEEEERVGLHNIGWTDAVGQDSDVVLYLKGDNREAVRVVELLKGRTIAGGGFGEYYIRFEFSPKLNFSEMSSAGTKTLKVSTIEG